MLLYVRLIATFFAQPGHARCSDAPCGSGGLPVRLRVVGHGLSVELGEALAGHRLAATAGGYLFKNGVRVYLFKNGARVYLFRALPGMYLVPNDSPRTHTSFHEKEMGGFNRVYT